MVEQNEYTEQAERFLQENGITFHAQYIGTGRHFSDDTEDRATYMCVLDHADREPVSFKFGQSLVDTKANNSPEAYDLLSCLQKSDPGAFEDFCDDFGYDIDSRKAYATWEAVCEEWRKVETFFTDEELDQLQEIN